MWNSNFLKMKRLWSGKNEGEITKNEKWESIENLSREEKGKSKEGKKKLRWEVFEESAWKRGRGHFLEGMKSFSREDKKREREKKKERKKIGVWEKSERSLRGVRGKVLREKERKVKERADMRNLRKKGGSWKLIFHTAREDFRGTDFIIPAV